MQFNPLSDYNPSEGQFLKVERGELVPYKATQWADAIFREFLKYLDAHTELLSTPFPCREELKGRIHLYTSHKTEVEAITAALPCLSKAKETVKCDLIRRLLNLEKRQRDDLLYRFKYTSHQCPPDCEISFLYLLLPFAVDLLGKAVPIIFAIKAIKQGNLKPWDVSLLQRLKERHPKEMEEAMRALPLESWEIDHQIDMIPMLPPDKIVSIVKHMSPEDHEIIMKEEHLHDGQLWDICDFFKGYLNALTMPGWRDNTIDDMVRNELPRIYLGQLALVAHDHPEYLSPYLEKMDKHSLIAVAPFIKADPPRPDETGGI